MDRVGMGLPMILGTLARRPGGGLSSSLFGRRPASSTIYYDVDYADVTKSFAAHGRRVEEARESTVALGEALDSREPAVVEVDKEATAPVT